MQPELPAELIKAITRISRGIVYVSLLLAICLLFMVFYLDRTAALQSGRVPDLVSAPSSSQAITSPASITPVNAWMAPSEESIPAGKKGEMIRYGKELVIHTSSYLGPKGSVAHLTNGMNCQNCHLDAGRKLFANNYAGFMADYPKMSGRSGQVEPASQRISECFERSLAGKTPDTSKKEVQAILAYMKWIGKGVQKSQELFGKATGKISFSDQAADPVQGKAVYLVKCQACHGAGGEGQMAADQKSYINPPLWGKHSYNDGAGMYRISNLAGFIKNNMPNGVSYQNTQLSDQEAWNLAAFINSQPRPHKDQHNDWKDLVKKPIDFPFRPYADHFSEKQHKFGPFKPIEAYQKEHLNTRS